MRPATTTTVAHRGRRCAVVLVVAALAATAAGGCGAAVAVVHRTAVEQVRTDLILAVPDHRTGSFRYWRRSAEEDSGGAADFARGCFLRYSAVRPDGGAGNRTVWVLNRAGDGYGRVSGAAGGGLPRSWARLDPAKLSYAWPSAVDAAADPAGAILFVERAVARPTGGGRYAGAVDLPAIEPDLQPVPPGHLAALGERAGRAPFTAAVDGQGRLTEVTVTVPAAGGFPERSFVRGYAYPAAPFPSVGVTAPPAPPALYTVINGY